MIADSPRSFIAIVMNGFGDAARVCEFGACRRGPAIPAVRVNN